MRRWARPELYVLHRLFGSTPTYLIAARLGRSYSSVSQQANLSGLLKHPTYMAGPMSGRLRPGSKIGGSARFPKGHIPHNVGLKGWDAGGRSHEGRFKRGQSPSRALPIGCTRINRDGLLEQKFATHGSTRECWQPVHRLVWIANHGPIPSGQVVAFRASQRTAVLDDITIERLELISRPELMRRNSYHRYPKELARLIQLRGALNRQIRKREKDAQQDPRSA